MFCLVYSPDRRLLKLVVEQTATETQDAITAAGSEPTATVTPMVLEFTPAAGSEPTATVTPMVLATMPAVVIELTATETPMVLATMPEAGSEPTATGTSMALAETLDSVVEVIVSETCGVTNSRLVLTHPA